VPELDERERREHSADEATEVAAHGDVRDREREREQADRHTAVNAILHKQAHASQAAEHAEKHQKSEKTRHDLSVEDGPRRFAASYDHVPGPLARPAAR